MAFEEEIQTCRRKIDDCDRHAVEAHGLLITGMVQRNPEITQNTSGVLCFSIIGHIAIRFMVTDKVGALKIKYGIPSVIQPAREQQVYDNIAHHNQPFEPLVTPEKTVAIWHMIHDESVRRQEAQKAAAAQTQAVA